jgi:serine O-acetyltransferase
MGRNVKLAYGGVALIIHEKTRIGNRVIIGTCVTIGAATKCDKAPLIGDDVYIGSGAKLLGNIRIGNNVIIGANAVVVKDVPSNCVVAGVPAQIIKSHQGSIWETMNAKFFDKG